MTTFDAIYSLTALRTSMYRAGSTFMMCEKNYTLDTITHEVKIVAANAQKAVIAMGGSENGENVVCEIIKSKDFVESINNLALPYITVQKEITEVIAQLKRFNAHCSTHFPNTAVLFIHPIGTYQFDIIDLINNKLTKAFWADYDILGEVYDRL
ncbi:hypothetical protein C9J21_19920 [Photobacterium phosphoreum]|uniref:hypothetical protein n=1 Tax=Photobacterium phosphoreum TaxID=659 RepID=UPI000D164327|nr:hypothetical protein [Photobacterium phosphoreum]PSW29156.1 hypothetical protein C9J21_19920 [Photobacterium phosphoreum]